MTEISAPIAGGDISTATRLRLSDGTTALMKTLPHAPEGFFAAEAAGLRWLASATAEGGVGVPEVLGADDHRTLNDMTSASKLLVGGTSRTVWTGRPGEQKAMAWSPPLPRWRWPRTWVWR